MIFVTLGTQDKGFPRLLGEIEKLINQGIIHDEVVVQAGVTKFVSNQMKIIDFLDMHEFDQHVNECTLMITHGGVGSILNGIRKNKKVIAVARRLKYDEHENEHQIEIVRAFDEMGYIVGCLDANDLKNQYCRLHHFNTKEYKSNNAFFCEQIKALIEE